MHLNVCLNLQEARKWCRLLYKSSAEEIFMLILLKYCFREFCSIEFYAISIKWILKIWSSFGWRFVKRINFYYCNEKSFMYLWSYVDEKYISLKETSCPSLPRLFWKLQWKSYARETPEKGDALPNGRSLSTKVWYSLLFSGCL